MQTQCHIILDEERAKREGGHYSLAVYFDDEPIEEVIAKVSKAIRALDARREVIPVDCPA